MQAVLVEKYCGVQCVPNVTLWDDFEISAYAQLNLMVKNITSVFHRTKNQGVGEIYF